MPDKELIELAEKNKDVSIPQIEQDILDTVVEIWVYNAKMWSYKGRFDQTYREEIKKRDDFIDVLENIIKGKELLSKNN